MTEIFVSPGERIQAALDRAKPGDIVTVRSGTYRESITISRSGTASAWLTLRGEPGAKLVASSWNGISITGNYVRVEGLDISGAEGDGIEGNGCHHVDIIRNACHGNGESGIQFNGAEFQRIEDNECYGNASSGWFSGISVYQNRRISPDRTLVDGYGLIVRGNHCHDNVTRGGQHTDGNGIIIDDMNSTQASGYPAWGLPVLVEGNLCHGNGGKGIQVTWSDNVTVRGNTVARNNVDTANDGTWRGDLSISESQGCTVDNNIIVCQRGSGRLAYNRAIGNTSQGNRLNQTAFSGNIAFDPSGVPSLQNDGGNPASYGADAIRWVDPDLGPDWLPRAAAAQGKGWGGLDAPDPNPEPTPEPEPLPEPDPEPTPEPEEPDPASYNVHSLFAGLSPTKVYPGEGPHELGTAFRFASAGTVRALRVYRLAGNGSATVRAWRGGKVVAKGTMASGAEGWVDVAVNLPVAAGDEIIVSWGKPNGKAYPAAGGMFAKPRAEGGISATAGLYVERTGALPTQTYQGTYYWTDVVFEA